MKRTAVAGLAAWMLAMVLAGCNTPTTRQLVEQGVTHFQTGRLAQAKATLKRALDQSPADPDALFYMGRIYHLEKFYERAIYLYECCLDADPSYADARRHLAEAKKEAGLAGGTLRTIPVSPEKD